jgi:glutamate-ammonia-ligase adenylyltransferase
MGSANAVPARRLRSQTAALALIHILTRAADLPDFATPDAFLAETEAKVRACFRRIVG